MARGKAPKPFFLTYFGVPHSGKTFDLEKFISRCGRETIFVYNSGSDKDWRGYIEIELISKRQTRKQEEQLLFVYNGKEYDFQENFMKMFRGKKVKAPEADENLTEQLLFKQLKRRGYEGLFFVIDDATNIIPTVLSKPMKACFYRAKHVNVWFALIFHDPNMFPVGGFNALTTVRFFKNNVAPPKNKRDKIPHFEQFERAYKQLLKAPEYSFCTLDMKTGNLTYSPYKKTK